MATKSSASELTRLINQLRQERQHHLDSIAEIDQTFKEFGINVGAAGKRGAGAAKPGRKRTRGRAAAAAGAETPAASRKGKTAGKKKGAKKVVRRRRRKGAAKTGAAAAAGGSAKPKSPWGSKFPVTGDELILTF